MKHIKKFNESIESFNLDFAISKIKENFTIEKVRSMFDDEWPNWVDDNSVDDLDEYLKISNGEAEEIVYDSMIDWYKKKFNSNIEESEYDDLMNSLKKIYNLPKI